MRKLSRRALLQVSIGAGLTVPSTASIARPAYTHPAAHPARVDASQTDKARLLQLGGELGGVKAKPERSHV